MQVVVFQVAGAPYALPVDEVREVVPYVRPRSLPAKAPWELGVVSIRGTVVRVWELATRLGLTPGEPGDLVVVEQASPLGLVVEKVIGLREIADAALAPMAYWPDALGVLPDGDELVVVLDPARLFPSTP